MMHDHDCHDAGCTYPDGSPVLPGDSLAPNPQGGIAPTNRERPDFPAHLLPYWGDRLDDPRRRPNYCPRQSKRTPAIPWHNGGPCTACGKPRSER